MELLAPDVAVTNEEWCAFEGAPSQQPPALSMVAAPQLPWAKQSGKGVRVVAVVADM